MNFALTSKVVPDCVKSENLRSRPSTVSDIKHTRQTMLWINRVVCLTSNLFVLFQIVSRESDV